MSQARCNYHHGDLRNALIIAAAELIEESGSIDFAMIDAARRAGVSSAAPYRHFRDKEALLEAVAELALLGLTEASRSAVAGKEPGSMDTIIALGKSYIQYMIDHAAFHDLMFGDMGMRAMEPQSVDLKATGFHVLVGAIEAYCAEENITEDDPVELATKMWALVHGLSALTMNHAIERFSPNSDVFDLLATSSRTFLSGLKRS